ncbi:MAG: hypothetical protein HC933_01205 [Pleurocapsa sp. SU_196_0]|nr:hypothetical protein [Pleurocapsa sp. SU_196_0]
MQDTLPLRSAASLEERTHAPALEPVTSRVPARHAHVNGELVLESDAKLHVSDLGLRRAYSVFEFFRVDDGVPVFWRITSSVS